jgi:hypothetical protein
MMIKNAKNLWTLFVLLWFFTLTPPRAVAANEQALKGEVSATEISQDPPTDPPPSPPPTPPEISPPSPSPSNPPGSEAPPSNSSSGSNVLGVTPSTDRSLTFESNNTDSSGYQPPPEIVVDQPPPIPNPGLREPYIPDGLEPPVVISNVNSIPEGSEPPITYYRDETEVQVAQVVIPRTEETKKIVAKRLQLEQVSFSCGQDGSTPSTIAKIKDQNEVVVILWSATVFAEAGYDPQTRCKQVSARFEKYQKAKALVYLTAGKINGQSVLCVTSKEEGGCGEGIPVDTEGGLLYTLKPGSNAGAVLEELATAIKSQDKATQKPLEE